MNKWQKYDKFIINFYWILSLIPASRKNIIEDSFNCLSQIWNKIFEQKFFFSQNETEFA